MKRRVCSAGEVYFHELLCMRIPLTVIRAPEGDIAAETYRGGECLGRNGLPARIGKVGNYRCRAAGFARAGVGGGWVGGWWIVGPLFPVKGERNVPQQTLGLFLVCPFLLTVQYPIPSRFSALPKEVRGTILFVCNTSFFVYYVQHPGGAGQGPLL